MSKTHTPETQATILNLIVKKLEEFGCCNCTINMARTMWPMLSWGEKEDVQAFFQNTRQIWSDDTRHIIQAAGLTALAKKPHLIPEQFKLKKEQ